MSKLISIAATLAFLAVSSGNLPWIIRKVRIAQLQLLKESQASNWGRPWTPPSR